MVYHAISLIVITSSSSSYCSGNKLMVNDGSPGGINLTLGYFSGWPWKKLDHYLNTTNNQRLRSAFDDLDPRLFAKLMTSM